MKIALWQGGDKRRVYIILIPNGYGLFNKNHHFQFLWCCSPGMLFLSLSAMGRRTEINHTQLQGQQCQSNDLPQETVSFIYITLCSWLLKSKRSD